MRAGDKNTAIHPSVGLGPRLPARPLAGPFYTPQR